MLRRVVASLAFALVLAIASGGEGHDRDREDESDGRVAVDIDPLAMIVRPKLDDFVSAADLFGHVPRSDRDGAAANAEAFAGLQKNEVVLLAKAADRRAVVKFDVDLQIRHQPLRRIAEFVFGQSDLLVGFRIHKMMVRTVRVKIFHRLLIEPHNFERVRRAKTMLERVAGQKISEARLHHRAQVARRMMPKFHHFDGRSFKKNYHSFSDIVC